MPGTGFYGIDISYAQTNVDWESISPEIDFVIMRAGYGQGHKDAMLASHYQACIDNYLHIQGYYWFSYALNQQDAIREAQYAVSIISSYTGNTNFVLWYDWEYDSDEYAQEQGITLRNADRVRFAESFCDKAIELGCIASGIYTNLDYLQNYGMQQVVDDGYPLWLAQWSGNTPSQTCAIWQYGIVSLPVTFGTSTFDGDFIGYDYPDPINPPIRKKKGMPLWMYLRYHP